MDMEENIARLVVPRLESAIAQGTVKGSLGTDRNICNGILFNLLFYQPIPLSIFVFVTNYSS